MPIRPIFLALAAAVVLPPPAPPADHAPAVRVFFSPRGGCTDELVRLIGSARRTVEVQAYSFTSGPIAAALIAAHRRGVAVRVVLDAGQRDARGSRGAECRAAGIDVRYDARHAIAHNKVVLVDGRIVTSGSFNLTHAAEASNAENLTVIEHRPTAALFGGNFARHRDHSEP